MKLYNKIFGKKDSLSIKDIENYNSGSLSNEQMHDIEQRANSSNLDSDAFDAFSENPENLNELMKIKAEVSSDLFKSTSYLKYFIITGIAAVLTIFFVFYGDIFDTNENNNFIASNTLLADETVQSTENLEPKVQEEFFIDNTSTQNELEKTNEISVDEQETDDVIVKGNTQRVKSEKIEYIQQKKMETITVDTTSINKKMPYVYNSNIKHIIHYKVVDYSLYKRENKNKVTPTLGLDARYANQDVKTKTELLSDADINVAYFLYLEKALYKYDNKEYSASIRMFNEILTQYPNDLNAFFYKGMAFYKLSKYEKSITNLDKVISNEINIFDQESEFYKAMSLMHTNKAEGIKLMQKIADDALFYSQKAMIELDKQKNK